MNKPAFPGRKTPRPTGWTGRSRSFLRLILQDLLRDGPVEELDEGSQAERADERAKAHQAAQDPAQERAQRIGEHAASEIRERRMIPQPHRKVIYTIYRASDQNIVATGTTTQVFLNTNRELELVNPAFYIEWKKKWNII